MSGHQSTRSQSVEWSTPPAILAALGPFDDDPCAPDEVWSGLAREWRGRVWLNPPYTRIGAWMERMAGHGQGTALVFARTETRWFAAEVWGGATAMLFLFGRLHFYRRGERAPGGGGAPSVLVAYGNYDAERLRTSGIPGAFVHGFHATRTDISAEEWIAMAGPIHAPASAEFDGAAS